MLFTYTPNITPKLLTLIRIRDNFLIPSRTVELPAEYLFWSCLNSMLCLYCVHCCSYLFIFAALARILCFNSSNTERKNGFKLNLHSTKIFTLEQIFSRHGKCHICCHIYTRKYGKNVAIIMFASGLPWSKHMLATSLHSANFMYCLLYTSDAADE